MKAPIRSSTGAVQSGLSGIAVLSFAGAVASFGGVVASFGGVVASFGGVVASSAGAVVSGGAVPCAPGRPVPPDSPSPRGDRA